MRKILYILIFGLMFIGLNAQQIPEETESGFHMGGAVGSVHMGDHTYSRIRLMPELGIGKVGIGLDIDLLIDEDGKIREDEWDDWEDYVKKIYYIRYGHRGDRIFARIGGFPSYTLGPGLVMKNYSNMLNYPDFRQIGLQLGGRIDPMDITIEGFSSDITENEILAGRITAKPLNKSDIPLLNKIQFGVTIATDQNQYGGIEDSDNDGYPDAFDAFPEDGDYWVDTDSDGVADQMDIDADNDGYFDYDYYYGNEDYDQGWVEDTDNFGYFDHDVDYDRIHKYGDDEDGVVVMGLDYKLPLIEKKLFTLGHYAEYSKIKDHSYGFIFPGFYSKFLIFDVNWEFRFYDDDYEPAYFDELYDKNRATVVGDTIITKEMLIESNVKSQGWFGSITSNLFNTLFLTISYEDMYGDEVETGKSIWGELSLNQTVIPQLTIAKLQYSQTDVEWVLKDFRTPTTLIRGDVGYNLGGNTILVYTYKEHYTDVNGDGEIKGSKEIEKNYEIGVQFRF